jgi:hypothetical protein
LASTKNRFDQLTVQRLTGQPELPISTRKEYLVRGREILLALKRAERLHANQDSTRWFDQAIHSLGEGRYKRFTDVAPLWRSH